MIVPGATDAAAAKGLGGGSYPGLGIGSVGTIISMCNLARTIKIFQ